MTWCALWVRTRGSPSEVSRICADLDAEVAAFRDRSLGDTTYPYVFLDATYCKARDPTSNTAPDAPFHAVPAGTVAVNGWVSCESTGSGTADLEGELDVLVTCQLDLSDPRVTGTETQDGFRILAGDVGAGDMRAADDSRITAAGGTWRGRFQAATDDASVPAPIGEAHYIGEGAYEGLEFHYYFADLDSAEGGPVAVHRWISPAPLTAALVSLTHAGKQWARGRDGSRPPSGSAPCPEDTVLYRINDTRHEVVVLRIDRRRDAYRPN
jgi:hypothetical protein